MLVVLAVEKYKKRFFFLHEENYAIKTYSNIFELYIDCVF